PSASTFTARMRRVSGERRGRTRGRGADAGADRGAAAAAAAGGACGSVVAVAIAHPIEGFDLAEGLIDRLELLAQALDVAVDGPVIDVDMLAIGAVHELVAALDVSGAKRERFKDQEFGDGQIDIGAMPGALMARRVEHEIAALDHRLAL